MPNGTEAVGFKKRRWQLPATQPPTADEIRLCRELQCDQIMARLLVARSLNSVELAREFLDPRLTRLHGPELLHGMAAAAEIIALAVGRRQRIVLFGDYDVDGITGTAMLWRMLKTAGAEVRYYIPHRVEEGYGMSVPAVERIAAEGCDLLISIDCGITALEPVAKARSLGLKVIVSDHHTPGAALPEAHAIIHPLLGEPAYPNANLCGAGVAFKLAWATANRLCGSPPLPGTYRHLLMEFLGLVALATIADVVPLMGENRILVKHGLAQIPRSEFVGIQALLAAAGFADRKIDGTAVGYFLAPRLNAAGRMDHAALAVELLTTSDPARAAEIAQFLEKQNTQRQATERKIVEAAMAQVKTMTDLPPGLVVWQQGWHAGVVGIVASRLVEAFHRPTFVLATDGQVAGGSARSIPGLDLHLAIEACRDLLISGGGHAAAGGVRLAHTNLELFRQRFCDYVQQHIPANAFVASMAVDGWVESRQLTTELVEWLEKMAPFGHGNPRPRFALRQARIQAPPRRVGAGGTHLQLQLNADGILSHAIGFRMGMLGESLYAGLMLDLVFEPKISEYQGRRRIEMHLLDAARSDREAFAAPAAVCA
jgi:single-stranded-DNA-specific exonuclease